MVSGLEDDGVDDDDDVVDDDNDGVDDDDDGLDDDDDGLDDDNDGVDDDDDLKCKKKKKSNTAGLLETKASKGRVAWVIFAFRISGYVRITVSVLKILIKMI